MEDKEFETKNECREAEKRIEFQISHALQHPAPPLTLMVNSQC